MAVTMKELLDFKLSDLTQVLASGVKEQIAGFLDRWGLTVVKDKIVPTPESAAAWRAVYEYFDKQQLVRKISLNSAYGALLNMGSRFYDQRIGQSTTLTGRSINRHQSSKINELLTGEYREYGETQIYCDTDSETADTLHVTNQGVKTIETLFNEATEFWQVGDKEYASNPDLLVMTYDNRAGDPYLGHINYIYRHRVSKALYEITDYAGNKITVTEDHSVMVHRDGVLVEAKPTQILPSDQIVTLEFDGSPPLEDVLCAVREIVLQDADKAIYAYRAVQELLDSDTRVRVSAVMNPVGGVKFLRTAEDEYVYDIGMRNLKQPWFFGNNILLHNSVYFSAYPIFKEEIARGELSWTRDDVIKLYDSMVPMINESFPVFLKERFNVPPERSTGVIKCGREIVAETGIWMVKKRYACLMIDKDGKRYDTDGKPGKVKAMGLDLRRSDTPKFMQDFLSEILLDTLTNRGENFVVDKVRDFKRQFEDMKPWQQGTPRKVNKLTHYKDKIEAAMEQKLKGYTVGNLHVPGHVTASLNWNRLREIHNDHQSTKIIDGQRIVVCKLKVTPENSMSSVAYPADETRLPEWFTSLPFAADEMMATVVDKKVSNLLSVLKWDFSRAKKEHAHLETLFDFS